MDGKSVQITLTRDEATMLQEVLRTYVSDLRMEIADTDQMDLREILKREEDFLKDLLRRLEVPEDLHRD